MNKEVIKFWDQESPRWVEHAPFGAALGSTCSFIRSKTDPILKQIPNNGKILDIGCGAGSYFGNTLKAQIINMDISLNMLMYNPGVMKSQVDVRDGIPIESNSLDFVSSFFLLRYLSKTDHIFLVKEIWRTLKVGGSFLLIDLPKNRWEYQQSVFSPYELSYIFNNTGFSDVAGRYETLTYFSGFNSGFGMVGSDIPFDVGYLLGTKIDNYVLPTHLRKIDIDYISMEFDYRKPSEAKGF